MHKQLIMIVVVSGLYLSAPSGIIAAEKQCMEKDGPCREFARLAEAEQYDKIIEAIDAKKNYSDASRSIIGQAYLMIAGRETNTAEQEEQFCRKALEYGSTSAYMGLYFIYASKDAESALVFLKRYIATKPKDSVPIPSPT